MLPSAHRSHHGRVQDTTAPYPALRAGATGPLIEQCRPHPTDQLVCPRDARCICPLAAHVTDAERAVMNDISRQASRLSAVLAAIFVVAALVAMMMLILR